MPSHLTAISMPRVIGSTLPTRSNTMLIVACVNQWRQRRVRSGSTSRKFSNHESNCWVVVMSCHVRVLIWCIIQLWNQNHLFFPLYRSLHSLYFVYKIHCMYIQFFTLYSNFFRYFSCNWVKGDDLSWALLLCLVLTHFRVPCLVLKRSEVTWRDVTSDGVTTGFHQMQKINLSLLLWPSVMTSAMTGTNLLF